MNLNNVVSERLDLLRGLAAQCVLVEHMLTYSGFSEVFIGSFGVVIFFVLSGFLIHHNTLTNHQRYGELFLETYMMKRFFRVFTLYIPVVILCFMTDITLQHFVLPLEQKVNENARIQNFFGSFLMLQQNPWSEVGAQIFGVDAVNLKPYGSARPLWTVAIEWWIYVAYGIAASVYYGYSRAPRMLSSVGFLFVFSMSIVAFNAISGIGNNLSLIWALGALVAHFFVKLDDSKISGKQGTIYAAMFLLLGLFFLRIFHMNWSSIYRIVDPYDFVNAIIFSGLFAAFLIKSPVKMEILRWRYIAKLVANLSYPLYLSHFTVLSVFYGLGWFEDVSFTNYFVIFGASNCVAFLLYHLIDKHHGALRVAFSKRFLVR